MRVGHNDPWVKLHMKHQHMWSQRSSKGHSGLLTFWLKFLKMVSNVFSWDLDTMILGYIGTYHLNRYGVKSNITMIAKECDRESRRNSWFENRLVDCPWLVPTIVIYH